MQLRVVVQPERMRSVSALWRCGLSHSERQAYGLSAHRDCGDLKSSIGRLDFDQLGRDRSLTFEHDPYAL